MNAVSNRVALTLNDLNKDIFPNIHHLLTILVVLPITTCKAEHSFSSLHQLKTYLRSTMGLDRLTNLALIHTHKDVTINISQIIENLAIEHPRRIKLKNILDSSDNSDIQPHTFHLIQ